MTPQVKGKPQHHLIAIDPLRMVGECVLCGAVPIKRKTNNGRGGMRYACRPAEDRHKAGRWRVLFTVGMTIQDLQLEIDATQGKCPICRKALGIGFAVDHDHSSGVFRGVICRPCNLGLGFFRDDIKALKRAAEYLKR